MADQEVEHEICGNCKREIPQRNYVMHTAHCARNITLCQVCKEPVPKADYPDHAKKCIKKSPPKEKTPEPPKTNLEKSEYYQARKELQDKKFADRRERYMKRHEFLTNQSTSGKTLGSNPLTESSSSDNPTDKTTSNVYTWGKLSTETSTTETTKLSKTSMVNTAVGTTSKTMSNGTGAIKKEEKRTNGSGAVPKPSSGLMPCRYCELELPKLELEDHENYCGSRTDKCLDCGEFVMFKHKQVHLDTNHGFVKLNDEPGPKPSWESTTQKSHSPPRTRRVFSPSIFTDLSQFDATDYLPSNYRIPKPKIEKGESYKEISRRLDCKTEYIRNLLHDSASITVPLRHSRAVPRNHFNHNKGPPVPPPKSRRNPPSELCIPCEFCDTPIPHMDYVEHERGCRPDKFYSKPRSRNFDFDDSEARAPSPDNEWKKPPQFDPPKPSRRKRQAKAELVIPCEFCYEPIPEDDLIQHQTGCRPDLARYSVSAEASASTPEVELPCEFCADMFPASQLFGHQATCN